jgi:hypothetical protein
VTSATAVLDSRAFDDKFSTTERLYTIALCIAIGTVGIYTMDGLYYLLFELYSPITYWWHHWWIMKNPDDRHLTRAGFEAIGASFGAQAWGYRSKKLKVLEPPPFFILMILCVIALFACVPGFALGIFLIDETHWHQAWISQQFARINWHPFHSVPSIHRAASKYPSVQFRVRQLYGGLIDSWPRKLAVLLGTFIFGRWVMRPVYAFVQAWFVERRLIAGKPLRKAHKLLVGYGRRYVYLEAEEQVWRISNLQAICVIAPIWHPENHRRRNELVYRIFEAIGFGLWGFGIYVIVVIAADAAAKAGGH